MERERHRHTKKTVTRINERERKEEKTKKEVREAREASRKHWKPNHWLGN